MQGWKPRRSRLVRFEVVDEDERQARLNGDALSGDGVTEPASLNTALRRGVPVGGDLWVPCGLMHTPASGGNDG